MFSVYCPGHRQQVLLFSDNIESLVNRPSGVELRWRCTCGTAGVERVGRERGPR